MINIAYINGNFSFSYVNLTMNDKLFRFKSIKLQHHPSDAANNAQCIPHDMPLSCLKLVK
jgi:hypothetical protein